MEMSDLQRVPTATGSHLNLNSDIKCWIYNDVLYNGYISYKQLMRQVTFDVKPQMKINYFRHKNMDI